MTLNQRLSYARERSGFTLAQVKARTEIGESSLSEFENGKREPSLSQLQRLARVYRKTISFFLEEGPIPEEPAVMWRQQPDQDSRDLESQFIELCEQYHNLEMWTDEEARVKLPVEEKDPDTYSFNDAGELAKRIHKELDLGEHPGQCLLSVLEEVCGVKIFHLSFDPTGTAASAVSDSFGAAVLLNADNSRRRRNFDLAHELFHQTTWNMFGHTVDHGALEPSDNEEKLANCFAANLLMPIDSFGSAINRKVQDDIISVADLFNVAREFDVSIEAIMWRVQHLFRKPTDSDRTKAEIEDLKACTLLYEESEQDKPPVYPERYRALAIKALRNGWISTGKFAAYLEISRQKAMQYLSQEESGIEEVQLTPA